MVMVQAEDQQLLRTKRKATSSLFLFMVRQERVGQQDMLDALSRAAMTSNSERFIWRCVQPYIITLSNNPDPPSLNQLIALGSSHVSWHDGQHNENMVTRWAAAASAVPYTEEVGLRVVDALLQIASVDSLRPRIPVGIWAWLKKRPFLPPMCRGRSGGGTRGGVVRHVRELGDIEVLKSYLLLVWSEWDFIWPDGFSEMCTSIREDFGGIEMEHHREDLIERLDHVLGQLDRGLEYLQQHNPSLGERDIQRAKEQYGELKNVLLEVDREVMDVPARTLPSLILFRPTDMDIHRIPLDLHVLSASCILVVCLENLVSPQPMLGFYNGSCPIVVFSSTLPISSGCSRIA